MEGQHPSKPTAQEARTYDAETKRKRTRGEARANKTCVLTYMRTGISRTPHPTHEDRREKEEGEAPKEGGQRPRPTAPKSPHLHRTRERRREGEGGEGGTRTNQPGDPPHPATPTPEGPQRRLSPGRGGARPEHSPSGG